MVVDRCVIGIDLTECVWIDQYINK